MHGLASISLLSAFCAAAVCLDIRSGRIPNTLSATGLILGAALALVAGGTGAFVSSLGGALLGLAIMITPFLLHMVGGGDVKFLAAAGSMVGWRLLWPSFLIGAALGGVLGLLLLMLKDRSLEHMRQRLVLFHAGSWRKHPIQVGGQCCERSSFSDVQMPYTLPLAIGLVAVTSLHFCR